jgi:hypothetical protein
MFERKTPDKFEILKCIYTFHMVDKNVCTERLYWKYIHFNLVQ